MQIKRGHFLYQYIYACLYYTRDTQAYYQLSVDPHLTALVPEKHAFVFAFACSAAEICSMQTIHLCTFFFFRLDHPAWIIIG